MMKEHFALIDQGHESLACWGRRTPANTASEYCFGSSANFLLDVGLTLLDGKIGFHSARQTDALIHRLDEFGPDVVHLHNLHGYYLNIDKLFKWLMRSDCRVVWTLHDCWAFTGHCLISPILAAINGKTAVVPRGALNSWGILQLLILHHANGVTRPNVRFSLRCLLIE